MNTANNTRIRYRHIKRKKFRHKKSDIISFLNEKGGQEAVLKIGRGFPLGRARIVRIIEPSLEEEEC